MDIEWTPICHIEDMTWCSNCILKVRKTALILGKQVEFWYNNATIILDGIDDQDEDCYIAYDIVDRIS